MTVDFEKLPDDEAKRLLDAMRGKRARPLTWWGSMCFRILSLVALFFSPSSPTCWDTVRMLDGPTTEELIEQIHSVPTHYATTFTEFYTDFTNGSNTNGGSDAGSPSMDDSAAGTGAVSTVTHQYTSVLTSGSVTVGQFISIYSGAATVPAFTSRITVVSGGSGAAWVITYSTTAIAGTEPTTGASYKAKVGGAWKGPNAAENFPFGYITNTLTDAAGDYPFVNMKNVATYTITANIAANKAGPLFFGGYTSTVRDGGKAIIDGGTTNAILLTVSAVQQQYQDLIVQNNATGTSAGISISSSQCRFERVVVNSVRNTGFTSGAVATFIECEAYLCNAANTAARAGFSCSVAGCYYERCVSHDNAGSNTIGFQLGASSVLVGCIADTNGSSGYSLITNVQSTRLYGCVSYNSTGPGLLVSINTNEVHVENCIFESNSTYGISNTGTNNLITLINNAYYLNTSGTTNGTVDETGAITLTGSAFTAPTTGNFTINNTAGAGAACRATGRGSFTETQASYTGSVSYPDVGACQVSDTANSNAFPITRYYIEEIETLT